LAARTASQNASCEVQAELLRSKLHSWATIMSITNILVKLKHFLHIVSYINTHIHKTAVNHVKLLYCAKRKKTTNM